MRITTIGLRTALLGAIFTAFVSLPAHAGFLGSTVEGQIYSSNVASGLVDDESATVSSAVEFGNSSNFPSLGGATVDVTDNSIIITNTLSNSPYCSTGVLPCTGDTFDGFAFIFTGAAAGTITGVTVDPGSDASFLPTASSDSALPAGSGGIYFTGSTIFLNFEGDTPAVVGSQVTIDVTFQGTTTNPPPPPVPEPATLALLGSGLLGLFGVRAKARSTH